MVLSETIKYLNLVHVHRFTPDSHAHQKKSMRAVIHIVTHATPDDPLICGDNRTKPIFNRTLSVDRPLFQALLFVTLYLPQL